MPNTFRFIRLAVLILCTGLAISPAYAASGWTTYENARFGYRLDYPADLFTPDAEPQNSGGLAFLTDGGRAEVLTYASFNAEALSLSEFRQSILESRDYGEPTYAPGGKTWFVLSGFDGNDIYYEKYMMSCGGTVFNAFAVRFPRAEKPFFAPVIERMEDSFRPGNGVDNPPSSCR